MTVTKIYHSREDLVAKLNDDKERVTYQDTGEDEMKIASASDCLVEYTDKLDAATEDYMNAMYEDDEDAPGHMAYSRREVVERWALCQAALSKLAWVMRFDGNEAYQRMMSAMDKGTVVDMSGL